MSSKGPIRKIAGAIGLAVAVVIGLVLVGLGSGAQAFKSYTISSSSMAPTLIKGDYVVASRFAYGANHQPERGDLVVFKRGATSYIKRAIGLPGERVQLKNGVVYVNDVALQRQQLAPGTEAGPFGLSHAVDRFRETLPGGRTYITYSYGAAGGVEDTGVYAVPPGHYFVLADNRDNGVDSRFPDIVGGGYVPYESLAGRAALVISSTRHESDARPGQFIHPLK